MLMINLDFSSAYFSNWLANYYIPYAKTTWNNTLFMITTDEDEGSESNHVVAFFKHWSLIPGTDATSYTHYSVTKFVENNFGLGSLGLNDVTANDFGPLLKSGTEGTSLTITSWPQVSFQGQVVQFTVTVHPTPVVIAPLGIVLFRDATTKKFLGNRTVNNGQAILKTTELQSLGVHTITVHYFGNGNLLGSSRDYRQHVRLRSRTTIQAFPKTVAHGKAIKFTVVLTSPTGRGGIPNGVVVLKLGNIILRKKNTTSSGKISFQVASLSKGSHQITASYQGNAKFAPSGSAVSVHIV